MRYPVVKRKTPAEEEIKYGRFLETVALSCFATNNTPKSDASIIPKPAKKIYSIFILFNF